MTSSSKTSFWRDENSLALLELSSGAAIKSLGRVVQCFSKLTEFVSLRLKQDSLTVHSLSTGKSIGMECTFLSSFFQSFQTFPVGYPVSSKLQEIEVLTVSTKNLSAVFRMLSNIHWLQLHLKLHPSNLLIVTVSQSKLRKCYTIPLEQNVVSRVVYSIATCSCRLSARPKMFQDLLHNFESKLEELKMIADKKRLYFYSSDRTRLVTRKSIRFHTLVAVDATEFDEYWIHSLDEDSIQLGFPFAVFRHALELAEQLNASFYVHFDQAGTPMILAIRTRGECLLDIDFILSTRKLSQEEQSHMNTSSLTEKEHFISNLSPSKDSNNHYVPLRDESTHLFSSNSYSVGVDSFHFSRNLSMGGSFMRGQQSENNWIQTEVNSNSEEDEKEEYVEGTPPR
ncbi:uncharacterized protein Gasu_48160 [Galdieria sulphuraria]|uniref:Uncharacterized protein n=1 Tax=Galdieria sulphuraria TaxID=130081 RepID=M2XCJ9_GALSU|nr:uncharacterized protein Gasu_48160 [Galdieria sulphuraria]EME27672.1 hypothetical protein Gasu_48160 [Galdieria sulphuraria]|eukprot:XP_005704192.1 hypothetical protein Gasu_48160 [Galdieria sulphuraria]